MKITAIRDNQIKTYKESNKIKNVITLILVSIFCIPGEVRYAVLGRSLGLVNYAAITMLLYVVAISIKNYNKRYLVFIYSILIYYIATFSIYEKNIPSTVIVTVSYILPLLFIGVKVSYETLENIFKKLLYMLNFIVIIITVIGILESILGIDVYTHLFSILTPRTQELILQQKSFGLYRLYSFMGHPLLNTQLYLMFFILNSIYSKYFKIILPNTLLIVISLIGIGMTASKTGFILIIISIFITSHNKNKINYIIMLILVLIVILFTDIFDNTIVRFMSGSLTTGRAEAWENVLSKGLFPIKFFTGYGQGFTFEYGNYVKWASGAFEYPIRMFSLELGKFMAILIYICIGIIPTFILLKRRHIYLFISYMILFLDVNTYNGLALAGDYMLIFSLFIFIILNLSRCLEEKRCYY
ncbi:MAG: hypothetical protein KH369_13080 [Paraclostridium bifermentans]|uniref:hypothetical protein n=1 Tax=Paraclostridium bifermentans TaxID=1490 RepID=UPI001D5817E4|nr:hypothetical protein [Paraclostridium bifermentans]MBS6509128.1 hypothetical protein [Paraclostridium bifermentans]